MVRVRELALLGCLAFAAAGCEVILGIEDPATGGADGDGGGDPIREAVLGLPCGEAYVGNGFEGGCPGGFECVFGIGSAGSPDGTVGYCAPFCFEDPSVCEEAYDGPLEGNPACGTGAEGDSGEFCTVGFFGACEKFGGEICPPEMDCQAFDFGGQILFGCGPIEWQSGGGDGGFNALGLLCGPNHQDNGFNGGCPSEHTCVTGIQNYADPDRANGYCSPICGGDDFICQDGFSGPVESEPRCAIGPFSSDICGMGFGMGCLEFGDSACPQGMVCHPYDDGTGQTITGCGGPSWVAEAAPAAQ